MYPFASLPENLIAFCAVLRRDHGFRIGPGELHGRVTPERLGELAQDWGVKP